MTIVKSLAVAGLVMLSNVAFAADAAPAAAPAATEEKLVKCSGVQADEKHPANAEGQVMLTEKECTEKGGTVVNE